jgi:hypothetical protein
MKPYIETAMKIRVETKEDTLFIQDNEIHAIVNKREFEQIGKVLPLDYQKIIDASACKENKVFEIFICY